MRIMTRMLFLILFVVISSTSFSSLSRGCSAEHYDVCIEPIAATLGASSDRQVLTAVASEAVNKQDKSPRKGWLTQLVTYGTNPFGALAYAQAEEYYLEESAAEISSYKDECLVASLREFDDRNSVDAGALYGWSASSNGGWVRLTSEPCPIK